MPPLEQTLSSMSLSLSLHSNNNDIDTYHHMKHSSVSRQTKRHSITGSSTTSIILPGKSKGNTPITTNISTTTTTTIEQRMMNELRTAKDGCIGSIMALLHFLSQHGVAASSICEETKQLKRISEQQQQQQETIASQTTILTQSTSSLSTTTTITIPYESMVRKIIKYYLVCINKHIRDVQEVDTIHMLLLGCWQTQYRYAKILYLYAHQYYNTIRFKNTNNSTINTANNTNYTTKQLQQQQHNQQHQQQGPTIITSLSYQYCDNKSTVLKKALQYQIQMAEYVCTCQKEILSCQRKYERQQQQRQQLQ